MCRRRVRLTQNEKGDVLIRVTLNEHLQHLAGEEAQKLPSKRRRVPNLSELADEIGVHRVTLSNLANNKVKLFNAETLALIINTLRRRGFETELHDILKAYPEEEVT